MCVCMYATVVFVRLFICLVVLSVCLFVIPRQNMFPSFSAGLA